ncbi:MAG: DUF3237 domain-containing protein [Spirochaetes bacterium]|nr:DUF3237 domain-containing protein [Spirochaetota bacterium]
MEYWSMIIGLLLSMIVFGIISSPSMKKEETNTADTKGFEPPKPKLEFLGRWSVDLIAPVWDLGQTSDLGTRKIIPITGGKFEGPDFKGTIQNNGADWQIIRKDNLAIIDTRYLLKTDDEALVYLQTRGYRYGNTEVLERMAKGEVVDPSLYFFRIYMQFETSAKKYDWLNKSMAIGFAMRLPNAVVYDAYLIK